MVEEVLANVEGVSARAVREGLESGEVDLVIDVREPNEWNEGHIPEAVNVPRGMLELRADPESPVADPALSVDKKARVIVYCLKAPGARSLLVAQILRSMGYSNVAAMRGGVRGAARRGTALESDRKHLLERGLGATVQPASPVALRL